MKTKQYKITYRNRGQIKSIIIEAASKKIAIELFWNGFCKDSTSIIVIEKIS